MDDKPLAVQPINKSLESSEAKGSDRFYWRDNGLIEVFKVEEKFLADCWIKTMDLDECAKLWRERFKSEILPAKMKSILSLQKIEAYVRRKCEEAGYANGWTKERYIKDLEDKIVEGKCDKQTVNLMKLLGSSLGYLESKQTGVNLNQQINITQADGNR
jgi:hypothetical protein